jgi:hypothetical protein
VPTASTEVPAPAVPDGDARLAAGGERSGAGGTAVRHMILLVLLYSLAAIVSAQPVIDPDIWWHLRTGQWIVQHGTVPTVDSFTWSETGRPWIAYSWLFDVVVYGLYAAAGIRGLLVYEFVLVLATLVALFHLVRLGEPRPARAVALTAVACLAMTGVFGPRSFLVSIVFFIVVLRSVLMAYRSGRARGLFLLVPVFAVWANVHVQFVYGLVILALVTADVAVMRWSKPTASPPVALTTLLVVDAACVVATLMTPYHVQLYRLLFDLARQTGVYSLINELRAAQFVALHDWAVLGLAIGAAFMLRRRDQPRFLTLLLMIGVWVSFRSNRDAWFLVVCATAILAPSDTSEMPATPPWLSRGRTQSVAALAAVLSFVVLLTTRSAALEAATNAIFPEGAAAAVEERRYPGPLYNHFNWGGYLIWRLPHLPVSMDGRSNLHGDQRIVRSFRTWTGLRGWNADPELSAARLVIASIETPLASLLQRDPRFQEVYGDRLARVFIARRTSTAERDASPTVPNAEPLGTAVTP